jgi:hypothetical protein
MVTTALMNIMDTTVTEVTDITKAGGENIMKVVVANAMKVANIMGEANTTKEVNIMIVTRIL